MPKKKSKPLRSRISTDILVDVIAPASSCPREILDESIKLLQTKGLSFSVPKNLFQPTPFFSNSDEERFEQLKEALLNEDSDFIWCVRGGYGSQRLWPLLKKLKKPKKKKILIGLSDITSLHIFLNQVWKWPTLHGPLLYRMASPNCSADERLEVLNLIQGTQKKVRFSNLKPMNEAAMKRQSITGKVGGGNLKTAQSSLGMKWGLRSEILFFEDIGERGYAVDRMLDQMIQAKVFSECKAVIFGDFIGGDEPLNAQREAKNFVNYALERFAERMKIPVLRGLECGHGDLQRPIPFLTQAKLLMAAKSSELVVERWK
jgi:muramoyltetrapeptide carboxypeptidase